MAKFVTYGEGKHLFSVNLDKVYRTVLDLEKGTMVFYGAPVIGDDTDEMPIIDMLEFETPQSGQRAFQDIFMNGNKVCVSVSGLKYRD